MVALAGAVLTLLVSRDRPPSAGLGSRIYSHDILFDAPSRLNGECRALVCNGASRQRTKSPPDSKRRL